MATTAHSLAPDHGDAANVGPSREATSRAVRALASSQAVNAVGDGCYNVTAALYFTSVVGLTAQETGLVLTLGWTLAFVLSPHVGRLADRVGLRLATIGLTVSTALALLGIAVTRSPAAIGLVFAWYAVSQGALGGTRQALIARVVPAHDRVRVRARVQVLVNSGFGLGALLGGAAFWSAGERGLFIALVIDVVAFVVAALLLLRLPDAGALVERNGSRLEVLRNRPYMNAAALSSVLFLYMPLLTVVLPLYLTLRTQVPSWLTAAVFVVNTVGVAARQVRAAAQVSDLTSARRSVRNAGALFGGACVLFYSAGYAGPTAATGLVLAGAALQVLGEVRFAAGSWRELRLGRPRTPRPVAGPVDERSAVGAGSWPADPDRGGRRRATSRLAGAGRGLCDRRGRLRAPRSTTQGESHDLPHLRNLRHPVRIPSRSA